MSAVAEVTPLAAPRKVRVQGVVYCLDHGSVHGVTTNPYDSDNDRCRKREHRAVYAGLRAGDWPEAG